MLHMSEMLAHERPRILQSLPLVSPQKPLDYSCVLPYLALCVGFGDPRTKSSPQLKDFLKLEFVYTKREENRQEQPILGSWRKQVQMPVKTLQPLWLLPNMWDTV